MQSAIRKIEWAARRDFTVPAQFTLRWDFTQSGVRRENRVDGGIFRNAVIEALVTREGREPQVIRTKLWYRSVRPSEAARARAADLLERVTEGVERAFDRAGLRTRTTVTSFDRVRAERVRVTEAREARDRELVAAGINPHTHLPVGLVGSSTVAELMAREEYASRERGPAEIASASNGVIAAREEPDPWDQLPGGRAVGRTVRDRFRAHFKDRAVTPPVHSDWVTNKGPFPNQVNAPGQPIISVRVRGQWIVVVVDAASLGAAAHAVTGTGNIASRANREASVDEADLEIRALGTLGADRVEVDGQVLGFHFDHVEGAPLGADRRPKGYAFAYNGRDDHIRYSTGVMLNADTPPVLWVAAPRGSTVRIEGMGPRAVLAPTYHGVVENRADPRRMVSRDEATGASHVFDLPAQFLIDTRDVDLVG